MILLGPNMAVPLTGAMVMLVANALHLHLDELPVWTGFVIEQSLGLLWLAHFRQALIIAAPPAPPGPGPGQVTSADSTRVNVPAEFVMSAQVSPSELVVPVLPTTSAEMLHVPELGPVLSTVPGGASLKTRRGSYRMLEVALNTYVTVTVNLDPGVQVVTLAATVTLATSKSLALQLPAMEMLAQEASRS
jgi:hypothetical protein